MKKILDKILWWFLDRPYLTAGIIVAIGVILSMAFTKWVVNSDLPDWYKWWLLKG